MKIFIDVDNTILEHSGFYSLSTEGRIHSTIGKYPLENQQAIFAMYNNSVCRNPDIVKQLFFHDDVYILTKFPAIEYEKHKQIRLAEILGIDVDELRNLRDKNGVPKYINLDVDESKVHTVFELFDIDTLEDCLLVDDYSANLIEWQNYGGIAIKYYNEYNSAQHPTRGLSISNFNFFKPFLTNKSYKNFMMVCNDSFILDYFSEFLTVPNQLKTINVLNLVIADLKKKFQIEEVNLSQKYDVKNFIVEYYRFVDNYDPKYWQNFFIKEIGRDVENVLISSSFDIDLRKITTADHSLGMKIIDLNKVPSAYIFDIYLTLDGEKMIRNVKEAMEEQAKLISKFVLGKEG